MPQTRDIAQEKLAGDNAAPAVTETRVDAAHSIGDAVNLPPLADVHLDGAPLADMVLADLSLADMPVEQAITELVRVEGAVQLQSQADQLAAHLREQQRELDRRESQINARVADFEQEVREARAWLAQRNDELTEREARLEARETALHGREEVAEARSSREAPSNANHLFLASAAAKASTDSGPREVKDATFGDDEPKLKMPPGGAASSDQRQWEAEWEERKQAMARVSEQLDQRRQALEKFRDEISLMHREALELHLVGEEAKAQLRSSLGIEAAEQALEAARERMVRRYRSDATQLIRSREELEWLRSDLAREHAKLERRYEELKGWIQGQRS